MFPAAKILEIVNLSAVYQSHLVPHSGLFQIRVLEQPDESLIGIYVCFSLSLNNVLMMMDVGSVLSSACSEVKSLIDGCSMTGINLSKKSKV
mmetsp:Transcript_37627/g.49575  ORF Transcript_37627/g.49575 Transcript_37627/m.49575 type:complete len:92 (+) Transcript_37627:1230-1505(+)